MSVYRWARVPRTVDGKLANVYQGPPDIAVEIVSPNQSIGEMIGKCRRYVAHGVEIALAVHPEREIVIRLRPDGTETTLRDDDRIDLDAVLPGSELTVQGLFDLPHVD